MDFIKTACSILMLIFGAWAAYHISSKPEPESEPESEPKERLTDEQEQVLNDVVEAYAQRADLLREQDNLLHGQPVSVIFRDNKNLLLSQEAISTAIEMDVAQKNRDLVRLFPESCTGSRPESRPESRFNTYRGRGKN